MFQGKFLEPFQSHDSCDAACCRTCRPRRARDALGICESTTTRDVIQADDTTPSGSRGRRKHTAQSRLRLLVADVDANADQPAPAVDIANDGEDAVTPAITEAAHSHAAEFELPRLWFLVADLPR